MFAARIPVQVHGTAFGGAEVYSVLFLQRVFPRICADKVGDERGQHCLPWLWLQTTSRYVLR